MTKPNLVQVTKASAQEKIGFQRVATFLSSLTKLIKLASITFRDFYRKNIPITI